MPPSSWLWPWWWWSLYSIPRVRDSIRVVLCLWSGFHAPGAEPCVRCIVTRMESLPGRLHLIRCCRSGFYSRPCCWSVPSWRSMSGCRRLYSPCWCYTWSRGIYSGSKSLQILSLGKSDIKNGELDEIKIWRFSYKNINFCYKFFEVMCFCKISSDNRLQDNHVHGSRNTLSGNICN